MKEGDVLPICKQVKKLRKDNNWLLSYARNISSQCGEDGILKKIFEIIPQKNNICVEFGAWDGKSLSNTWNLVENHGWQGLFIEANKERFEDLIRNHYHNQQAICLNRFVEYDGHNSLDNILQEVGFPIHFDLISIDIDGNDWYIWDSIKMYQPKVVVIEFNQSIPNDIIFIQDKDIKINQGCSLLALIELGKQKEYELIATTSWNAIFVRKEYFSLFNIEDNSIDCMYDDTQFGMKIFQLYDGTLTLSGVKRLFWHDIEICDDDIQIIPKNIRRFPDHTPK